MLMRHPFKKWNTSGLKKSGIYLLDLIFLLVVVFVDKEQRQQVVDVVHFTRHQQSASMLSVQHQYALSSSSCMTALNNLTFLKFMLWRLSAISRPQQFPARSWRFLIQIPKTRSLKDKKIHSSGVLSIRVEHPWSADRSSFPRAAEDFLSRFQRPGHIQMTKTIILLEYWLLG